MIKQMQQCYVLFGHLGNGVHVEISLTSPTKNTIGNLSLSTQSNWIPMQLSSYVMMDQKP